MKKYIILLLIFFISCSQNNKKIESELSIVKINEIILEETEPLFGRFLEHFQVSDDNKYWIFYENIRQKIYIFNNKGNFVNILGKTGRGPEGIVQIAGFDIDEQNRVLIYDSGQRLLKIFKLDGKLIKTSTFLKDAAFGAIPFEMIANKNKIITTIIESQFVLEPHNSRLIAVFDYEGNLDTLFGKHDIYSKKDRNYVFTNKIAIDDSDVIYTNLSTSPYIQSYALDDYQQINYFGQVTESHTLPSKEIHGQLSITEIKDRAKDISTIFRIYTTDKYIIQHMQILTEKWHDLNDLKAKKNILVVYDKQTHEFIKEIPVPHTLGAVHNNKLYFIEDFNPDKYTIGIYEFVTEK